MRDLSVIIPARNEIFLQRTIEEVLSKSEADTEVIAVLDGYWPAPPVLDNDRVIVVHHTKPIGQRAATNEGARISQAKYIMKLDAHCALDQGFDRKMIEDCQPDWMMIPAMWNLHAFDWVCKD
jgi:glycosyltransferase involved in cell wall biosynthesis